MRKQDKKYEAMGKSFGYSFCGFWENMYHFSKEMRGKYIHLRMAKKDLDNNNHKLFFEKGLTK